MFHQQDANIHGQGNQELIGIVWGHSLLTNMRINHK